MALGQRFRCQIHAYVEFRVSFSIVVCLLSILAAAGGAELLLPEQMLWLKIVVDILAVLALAPVLAFPGKAQASRRARDPRLRPPGLSLQADAGARYADTNLISAGMAVCIAVQAVLQIGLLGWLVFSGPMWMEDCVDAGGRSEAHVKAQGRSCHAVLPNGLSDNRGWNEMQQHYLYSIVFNVFVACQLANMAGVGLFGFSFPSHLWVQHAVAGRRLFAGVLALVGLQVVLQQGPTSPLRSAPIDATGWAVCTAGALLVLAVQLVLMVLLERCASRSRAKFSSHVSLRRVRAGLEGGEGVGERGGMGQAGPGDYTAADEPHRAFLGRIHERL